MRRKVLIYILVLIIITMFGQNNKSEYITKILPSSPEAYKLSSYGNINVGLFTGTINNSIDLFDYKIDNFVIPINLNYSSSGIKIDDMNGSVGLGWTFKIPGIVSRTIRGLPDEQDSTFRLSIKDIEIQNPKFVDYLQGAVNGKADTQQDVYMASFGSNHIKFLFDKKNKSRPILLDKGDFIIEKNDGFKIIDATGIIYFFSEKEYVTNRAIVSGNGHKPEKNLHSWYLSKILLPTKKEIIFEYYSPKYIFTSSREQTMSYTEPGILQYKYKCYPMPIDHSGMVCDIIPYVIPPSISSDIEKQQVVEGKQLKSIYTKEENGEILKRIDFLYDFKDDDAGILKNIKKTYNDKIVEEVDFVYYTTINKRLFLKEIINKSNGKNYKFEYTFPERLPERLSFKRDMWGFFNNKDNNTLIPQIFDGSQPNQPNYPWGANQAFNKDVADYGLLNSITYPTGGNTKILYEPHQKDDKKIIVGDVEKFMGAIHNGATNYANSTEKVLVSPIKDNMARISLDTYFNNLDSSCSNIDPSLPGRYYFSLSATDNKLSVPFYIKTDNKYSSIGNIYEIANLDKNEIYLDLKKNSNIEIKMNNKSKCASFLLELSSKIVDDTSVSIKTPIGGLRVKTTVDSAIGSFPLIKNYFYKDEENNNSIKIIREPYFLEYIQDRSYAEPTFAFVDSHYWTITSSTNDNYISFTPNIFYSTVIEEISGKGKVIHQYNSNYDTSGRILVGDYIGLSQWSNVAWDNGNEILTTYKDVKGNILKTTYNDFIEEASTVEEIEAISIRKKFYLPSTRDFLITCNAENVNMSFKQYFCIANHTHLWYSYSETCHGAGHIDYWETVKSLCFDKPIGKTIITPNTFENLDIVQYKNISRFSYLQSQKTTDYLNGKPLLTTTEYFYNNPSHYQLTSQKTTFPDLSNQTTNYSYAGDKPNQKLIEANMVGIPLIIETKKNGKTISKTETVYPDTLPDTQTGNLLLPKNIISNDLQGNSSLEVTYDQYDSKGNLQQYTTKDGVSTVIIWGYNSTQPIAKIDGTTYSQVQGVSTIIASSDIDANQAPGNDESALLSALDSFRTNNSNYQITTYTYDPLIGVRSITPPSGMRELYYYDTANRLQFIKDINNKILKEYKYNYKQ